MKGREEDARAVLSCKLLCKLNRNILYDPTFWNKFLDTEVLVFNCVLTERVERVLVQGRIQREGVPGKYLEKHTKIRGSQRNRENYR